MDEEANEITHTIVDDPKTGKRVRVPVAKAAESSDSAADGDSTAPARQAMKLVTNPDASNPLTYTAAVQIGDLVLAVDDHEEESFAELVAQDEELGKARKAAADAYNAAVQAKATADDLKPLAEAFEALDAQRLSIGREVVTRKVKGVRDGDGQFYPVGDARPLRTLPARVELLNALSQRATLGASDKDFLAKP